MQPALIQSVEELIFKNTGQDASIIDTTHVGGGSINQASKIILKDSRSFFVKSNAAPLPRMFECEAAGLEELSRAKNIRIPTVIGFGEKPIPFFVIEFIESGKPKKDFFYRFGQAFAQMHRECTSERFGFKHDNYIGSTQQLNRYHDDWVEFFRVERLEYQIRLAVDQGFHHLKKSEGFLLKLDEFIRFPEEPATLLHGDLWSGNYLCDDQNNPVLIDPAVYYGRREADLAMTKLFGGYPASFYQGYEELWPLGEGAFEREEIYKLYHLLNHLNLFGGGYLSSCLEIIRRYS